MKTQKANGRIAKSGQPLRWLTSMTILALTLCVARDSRAISVTGGVSATYGPGGTTVTSVTATVNVPAATPGVTAQFTTSTGTPIGAPVPVTVGPGGVITIPGTSIPAAAAGLGNKVFFRDTTALASQSLVWYNSAWIWGISPNTKIDPHGLPGFTPTQSWFIQQPGLSISGTSNVFGNQSSTLQGSNFDVSYTNLGNGSFTAQILGGNSFLRLSNGTYIGLPDVAGFGLLDFAFNDGNTADGSFDFSAIGMAGLWSWTLQKDYTGAFVFSFDSFDAPAISTVPEPGSLLLLGSGFVGLSGLLRKRLLSRG